MGKICPLMSTPTNNVECTIQCALFLKDGTNATCAININAIHANEIEKKLDLLSRNNRM